MSDIRPTRLNKKFKAAWLAALRSGHYKQGKRKLRQDNQFCCLGVGCDVLHKLGMIEAQWIVENEVPERPKMPGYTTYGFDVRGATNFEGKKKDASVSLPGVAEINVMFEADWRLDAMDRSWVLRVPGGFWEGRALYELNDEHNLSFAQIADIIEEHF